MTTVPSVGGVLAGQPHVLVDDEQRAPAVARRGRTGTTTVSGRSA